MKLKEIKKYKYQALMEFVERAIKHPMDDFELYDDGCSTWIPPEFFDVETRAEEDERIKASDTAQAQILEELHEFFQEKIKQNAT